MSRQIKSSSSSPGEEVPQQHVDTCADAAVIAAQDAYAHLARYADTDPMAAALRAFDRNFPEAATREQIRQALVNRAATVPMESIRG